ncbi:unnamed protein product, partial [Rotaria sp. Silwood1]
MEFHGFVFQQRLTCLSQYNYLIYFQRLYIYKANDYVIDFVLTKDA